MKSEYAYTCKLRLLRTYSFGGDFRTSARVIAEALAPGTCPGGLNNAERALQNHDDPGPWIPGGDGTCIGKRLPVV